MKSRTTVQFRESLVRLPDEIRQQARTAYRQFQDNPNHPSLRFKKVHPTLPIYSARINKSYRAVGQLHDGSVVWFWVGSHTEYGQLLDQL